MLRKTGLQVKPFKMVSLPDCPAECKYHEEKEAIIPKLLKAPLRSAKTVAVAKLNPNSSSVTLKVKLVSLEVAAAGEGEEAPAAGKSCLVGDATGVCVYEIHESDKGTIGSAENVGKTFELRNAQVEVPTSVFSSLQSLSQGSILS